MQKRHFQMIAETIAHLDVGKVTRRKVAQGFADALEYTNGRFDGARFLYACGVGSPGRGARAEKRWGPLLGRG